MTRPHGPSARPTFDTSAFIWGLIFLAAASIGLLRGLGHTIDWQVVGILAPIALIALGLLGLAINRFHSR